MDDVDIINTQQNNATLSTQERYILTSVFAALTLLGVLSNAAVLIHIVTKRLYRNFVSSHFIAHLMIADLVALLYLMPVFLANLITDGNIFDIHPFMCRLHLFLTCVTWTVVYYMVACIAGVHLITFARIHYDQMFGLSPSVICALSWLVGAALGLPCLTNSEIAGYDVNYDHCLYKDNSTKYKFLAYLVLLGVILPLALTYYAYMRILAIFYHSPIVFQALGIFKSRYLVFAIMLNSLMQWPLYMTLMVAPDTQMPPVAYPVFMFMAYSLSLLSGILYGLSVILMKEDDIALTHRAHRRQQAGPTYVSAGVEAPHV